MKQYDMEVGLGKHPSGTSGAKERRMFSLGIYLDSDKPITILTGTLS